MGTGAGGCRRRAEGSGQGGLRGAEALGQGVRGVGSECHGGDTIVRAFVAVCVCAWPFVGSGSHGPRTAAATNSPSSLENPTPSETRKTTLMDTQLAASSGLTWAAACSEGATHWLRMRGV